MLKKGELYQTDHNFTRHPKFRYVCMTSGNTEMENEKGIEVHV